MLFPILPDCFSGEVKEMSPADRKNLKSTIFRQPVDFRVQSLKVGGTRIDSFECLTEHIDIVYEIDTLSPTISD